MHPRSLRTLFALSAPGRYLVPLLALSVLASLLARPIQAGAEIVPGAIVVRMKPSGPLGRPTAFRDTVGEAVQYVPQLQVYQVRLHPGVNPANALAKLRRRADVLYAHPLHILHAVATPNDPKYSSNQYGPQKIQANLAWDLYQPKARKVVAIVDTGVNYTHPDLANVLLKDAGNNVTGWNAQTGTANAQDDHGHGTHCAGVAAGQINNGIGIAGVAGWNPNVPDSTTWVKVMPVKVLDSTGSGTDIDVATGIVWATDHGANIISMSLGDTQTSETLNDAVKYAWDHGLLVVAAAGNNGNSTLFYPAACDNVISVAATDSADKLTWFSNYGSWVKVAAPGESIYSTYLNGGYATMSGTSMATPHVAGEAALLWAHAPTLTNAQISAVIQANVDPYTPFSGGHNIGVNAGRINAYKAIQALNLPPAAPAAPTNLTATPGNAQVALSWSASSGATSYNVKLSTTAGGPYSNIATGVTTTSYTDTGLTNGTKYYYVVSAVNAGGESGNSNEVSATPSAPTNTASAVFLNLDTTTQGSWKSVYGSDGYAIAQLSGGTSLPAYAQWSVTSSKYTWNGSTTDVRALQKVATSDRIAACWYGGSFTASLNLTDGQAHQVALYVLDWDSNSRAERIDILDATTNAVLNSQTVSSFNGGKYLVWSISGNVKIKVTYIGGANGVLSGLFFDTTGDQPPAPPAAPTNLTATPGNGQVALSWSASSGATAYNVKRSTTAGGPYTPVTSVTTTGYTDTGLTNGTKYYYVVTATGDGGESGNSNEASATPLPPPPAAPTNLTATPGNAQVALSWSASSGATSYNVKRSTTAGGPYSNIATGVTTTSYTDTGLTNGTKYYYVVSAVNVGGESGNSNEVSATPTAPQTGTSAVFLNLDTTSHGTWKGVYGSDGYSIAQLAGGTSLPSYAQWSVSGQANWTWSGSTTDVRALQKVATSDRIASCWYGGAFTASLNLTDGQAHQVALYVLDWDSNSRAERIDILDATTNAVLNSQTVSSFNGGKYLVWSISGNVKIRFTRTGGANAVLNGVFFK